MATSRCTLWSLACLAFVDEKGMNHHLDPHVRQMSHRAGKLSEQGSTCSGISSRVPQLLHTGGST